MSLWDSARQHCNFKQKNFNRISTRIALEVILIFWLLFWRRFSLFSTSQYHQMSATALIYSIFLFTIITIILRFPICWSNKVSHELQPKRHKYFISENIALFLVRFKWHRTDDETLHTGKTVLQRTVDITELICMKMISNFLFIQIMHNNIAKNVKIYIQIFIKMPLHISVLTTIVGELQFVLC